MREFNSDREAALAPSLCSGTCRHEPGIAFCLDCFRTKLERVGWRTMTFEERLKVLARMRERKQSLVSAAGPGAAL